MDKVVFHNNLKNVVNGNERNRERRMKDNYLILHFLKKILKVFSCLLNNIENFFEELASSYVYSTLIHFKSLEYQGQYETMLS